MNIAEKLSIFTCDLSTFSAAVPHGVTVKRAGSNDNIIATEADHSGFDIENFRSSEFDTRYFFEGLERQDLEDLINRRAYLEFWLPVVDHEQSRFGVSGNSKYYSAEDLDGAMMGSFTNRMNTGGVEGELDHPALHVYSDQNESAMNFQNNMSRLARIDKNNVVWYVTGFKRINNVTFFKFRTSLANNLVVTNMLNGKAPSASVRFMGNFKRNPETGIWRGENIKLVTVDYVDNPGFKIATLFKGAIDMISAGSDAIKQISFTNNQNKTNALAFESDSEMGTFMNNILSNSNSTVSLVDSLHVAIESNQDIAPVVVKKKLDPNLMRIL